MVAHDSWAKVYDEVYERSFKGLYEPLTQETLKLLVEEAFSSDDYIEGTSAFMEKRPPLFRGK